MKWPQQLLLIRHAESSYNALKRQMNTDAQYQRFKEAYAVDPLSRQSRELAVALADRYPAEHADMSTPLASGGLTQAQKLGKYLRHEAPLPDVVYVSPYTRAWATLSGILDGWPELAPVRVVEEARIREQEFGTRLLYSDWRFFFALHPEQQRLLSMQGYYWYRYPQGENVPDVRERNRSWMNTLTRDFTGQRILAITHHVNILAFRTNMERLGAQAFLELDMHQQPHNCSMTMYRGTPEANQGSRFGLMYYNKLST